MHVLSLKKFHFDHENFNTIEPVKNSTSKREKKTTESQTDEKIKVEYYAAPKSRSK